MNASLVDIEAVYRERGADFFRLALARTGNVEAARDAVQEGFAKALRARLSYRGAGSVEAWVARCVVNAANDASRRARPAEATRDDDAAAETEPTLALDAAIVRDAVAQLPQRQRDALYLRFYLDFDYATIAETLGIEVGTVSATLHQARSALAAHLQEVMR